MLSTENEIRRLKALKDLEILDSKPEPGFDQITEMTAELFAVPTSLITLIDADRQWFKSCFGIEGESTARDVAFCDYTIRRDEVMIVPDARLDPRFCNNPMVTGEPHVRFYAGAPIRYDDVLIGSLCIVDYVPRSDFSPANAERLRKMAAAVSSFLAMRKDGRNNRAIIRKLEDNKKRLELMEEAAGIGYWLVDYKAQTLSWSRGIYAMHGLSPDTFQPTIENGGDYFLPEDRLLASQFMARMRETGEGFQADMQFRRADGEVRTIFCKGSGEQDGDGNIETVFGVIKDVTEQREFEETLTTARRNAETYAQAQSDFLSNMSHEIRTPLTTILGYANLLDDRDDLPEEAMDYTRRIHKGGKALLSLVNDILDFSKLEAGLVSLDPHPTDVGQLAQDMIEQFLLVSKAKKLTLTLQVDEDANNWVMIDDARLTQVLYNLVGNACKFTQAGFVTLKVAVTPERAGFARLRVEVSDSGPGITPEHRLRLFKRFQQADNSINRQHGGTGLGLSICAEIVKLMHGDIGVESEPGKGAHFWLEVSVPVAKAGAHGADDDAYIHLDLAAHEGPSLLQRRVL
jgi:PAS domain S-box-containing protein